jgi:hypothetical protein
MSFFDPAPKPASLLGYHRVLAPTAGIKCSPLCLGAMNFGTGWYDFPTQYGFKFSTDNRFVGKV